VKMLIEACTELFLVMGDRFPFFSGAGMVARDWPSE
jgi:hypothetical protein